MAMHTGTLSFAPLTQGIYWLPKFQVHKKGKFSSVNDMQYADLQSSKELIWTNENIVTSLSRP